MIVDNRPVQCLIDSGSEASIFPSKYVRQESIQRTNNSLRAANGSNIPVLGEAVVPIRVGGFRSDIKAISSDHIPEPMIGYDWLRDVGAVLDFGGNRLMLNGRWYILQSKVFTGWVRRIVVQADTQVPNFCECNVEAKMEFSKLA